MTKLTKAQLAVKKRRYKSVKEMRTHMDKVYDAEQVVLKVAKEWHKTCFEVEENWSGSAFHLWMAIDRLLEEERK